MFCGDDYINNLYDFGRLYSYTCKSDPALIACTVILTEYNKSHKKQYIYNAKRLPLLPKQIRVKYGQDYEHADSQEH